MDIFIIDDDQLLCFILKKQIERYDELSIWGTATNGSVAIEMLTEASRSKNKLPDVILLDLNMPVLDGWMFLNELKKSDTLRSDQFCICMLSSSINKEDHERSKGYAEVKHFFTKPLLDTDIETIPDICS